MFKSEIWDVLKRMRENDDVQADWRSRIGRANVAGLNTSDEASGDLLPKKSLWQLEMLPFVGLLQAPHRTFTNMSSTETAPFASASSRAAHAHVPGAYKLDKKLLDIAFFPKNVIGGSEALDERDVVEDQEDERVVAPAVKMEDENDEEEELPVAKLYLSDDDIDDF